MSADALYQSFLQYLDVKSYALQSSIQGNEINVGETFTLRVRVTNNAPSGTNLPNIRYRNVRVIVRGTEYARPVDGNPTARELGDTVLSRNQDDHVDFTMRAERAIFDAFGTIPGILPEQVARITVNADIDQNAFFRITETTNAVVDIVTT